LPFLFAYTPLLLTGPVPNIIETVISCTIAIIAFAGMMQGYWLRRANPFDRLLLGLGAFCLFVPNIYSDVLGLGFLAVATFFNLKREE